MLKISQLTELKGTWRRWDGQDGQWFELLIKPKSGAFDKKLQSRTISTRSGRRGQVEVETDRFSGNVTVTMKPQTLIDTPELQLSALFAMGTSADPRWLPILVDEMESPNSDMRAEAARAMAATRPPARAAGAPR